MNRRQRWREKARAYRDFGMTVADADLRHALFIAAEIYSREAERVAGCGRIVDPSPFATSTAATESSGLNAAEAQQTAASARQYLAAAYEDPSGAAAAPLGLSACEPGWWAEMNAGYVRQQAAKYRKRAGEIGDPASALALLSLAQTCERLADDIEARAARRAMAFRVRKPQ